MPYPSSLARPQSTRSWYVPVLCGLVAIDCFTDWFGRFEVNWALKVNRSWRGVGRRSVQAYQYLQLSHMYIATPRKNHTLEFLTVHLIAERSAYSMESNFNYEGNDSCQMKQWDPADHPRHLDPMVQDWRELWPVHGTLFDEPRFEAREYETVSMLSLHTLSSAHGDPLPKPIARLGIVNRAWIWSRTLRCQSIVGSFVLLE